MENKYEEGNLGEDKDRAEEEQALKAFLLDIECLDPLSEWTNNFTL